MLNDNKHKMDFFLFFFFLFFFFCSFMGRGVIEASPLTVWEAVKNPLSRYIYDNMLKVLFFIGCS